MTKAERELLLATARLLVETNFADMQFYAALKAVEAETPPITPRAKYVQMCAAPDVNGMAARWKNFAFQGGKWNPAVMRGDAEAIYNAIVALGANPDRDAIAKIIGNRSWTHLTCDGCGDEILRGVTICRDYGGEHTYCFTCIAEAAQLIEQSETAD